MKPLSSRVEGCATPLYVLFMTIAALTLGISEAGAYEDYSDCANCHGDFRDSPYTSLSDGSNWGNDLHDIHRNDMLAGDCDTCHSTGGRSPVLLDSSDGGNGLAAISCVGCHGREQDMGNDSESAGRGAGLRQHHTNAGVTSCQGCHSDANPANYTPVGEDILPSYFANSGTGHPLIPTDSCNPTGEEDFAGTPIGLDNDGDGDYDTIDSDCSVIVTYTVGGNVSGLVGSGLALQNNGADTLAVASSGSFTFSTELESGSAYAVTVSTQPTGQTCSVTNGSGTIATSDITNVAVTCITDVVPTYSVGGNVSGLVGSGLALQNNGADTLAVASSGPFTFSTELESGSAYAITVSTQPTGQTCSVTNGSGTIATSDITNVAVTCITDVVPTYSIGGTVSGLTGTGLALQNNGTDTLAIASNGPFAFATELESGSAYAVTVSTQPTGQTCSVTNGTGTISGADISNVSVICETHTFSVGGNVSGLSGSGLMLQNNATNDLPISTNGSFTFTLELVDSSGYSVTVKTQPVDPDQICIVTNGSGTLSGVDVNNVQVNCTLATSCNGNIVSGIIVSSNASFEACDLLMVNTFIAEDGISVRLSSGKNIVLESDILIEQGATLTVDVCGQSLCKTSPSPMPYGCHSCVVQICDMETSCCDVEFDQACLNKVDTVCGLVCE